MKTQSIKEKILRHMAIERLESELPMSGLYVKDPELRKLHPEIIVAIPLKKLEYNVEVINHLAKVNLGLEFENKAEVFLEAEYCLPIDPKIVVHQFVAKFGEVVIVGEVKQKEQAKKDYEEGLVSGKQVAYGEINKDSYDIMNLKIGNIPPQSIAKITIQFVQQLEVEMNSLYKLRIPSTITPRYINDKKFDNTFLSNLLKIIPQYQQAPKYTWTFALNLKSDNPLVFNNSSTHQLFQTSQTTNQADFIMSQNQTPNKDFVFVYSTQNLMSGTMGTTDISTCAAISFIPKYAQLKADDAFSMMIKGQQLDIDMQKAAGQYIFVLDRSGSMSGGRINKAIQALKLFIKSLPPKTVFNIVSFGSHFQNMFPRSVQYNDINIKKALDNLSKFSADLGGTQIQAPLKHIFNEKPLNNYPRQIFLLTDGDVSNTNQVIKLVAENIKYSRVHTIGIGSGCSTALVKGCAEKGKGKAVFIQDGDDISSPIIELLEQSLTPIITSFSLDFDESVIQSIVPNPKSMPFILKNQAINFYIIFKNGFTGKTTFNLRYTQSVHNIPYESTITIDTENAKFNFPFIDKMVRHKIITVMVDKLNSNKPIDEDMLIAKVEDLEKQVVRQSVKYQVLCPLTAYVCVGKELVDGKYVEFLEKGRQTVIVPQFAVEKPSPPKSMRRMAPAMNMSSSNSSRPQAIFSPAMDTMLCRAPTSSLNSNLPNLFGNALISKQSDQDDDFFGSIKKKMKMKKPSKKSQQSCMLKESLKSNDLCLDKKQVKNKLFQQDMQCQQQQQLALNDIAYFAPPCSSPPPPPPSFYSSTSIIQSIISSQKFDGSWQSSSQLISKLFPSQLNTFSTLSQQINPNFLITLIIYTYLSTKHNTPSYSLLIKKAKTWITKTAQTLNISNEKQTELAKAIIIN